MRRHLTRLLLALALGTVPVVLGVGAALLSTGPGLAVMARVVGDRLGRSLRGHFEVGAISGSVFTGVNLSDVVVRDTAGELVASLPAVRTRYLLASLLARRIVLHHLELDEPVIHVTKRRSGRMNYEEVLRLGESPPGGLPGPLVEFRDVWIRRGLLVVALPWSPPDSARTSADASARALARDRTQPGRVIVDSRDGLHRLIRFAPLTAHFLRLRIATPDHQPLSFEVDTLATAVSDPAITVTDLVARGWTKGDSLVFTVMRGALPGTRVRGGGAVTWPRHVPLFDFAFVAPTVDLADLRWVSAGFPALTGRARLEARAETDRRTAYAVPELELSGAPGAVSGGVTVLLDQDRGLGFRDMHLDLDSFDVAVARFYAPSLPFEGRLSGPVSGRGYLTDLDLDLDWQYDDSRVEGGAENSVSLAGHVLIDPRKGLSFRGAQLRNADLDMRTVRLTAPPARLNGRLVAAGTLDGPLANIAFDGDVEHQDGSRPVTRAHGRARLDTRHPDAAFDVDVRLDPLAFEGLRGSFPGLTMQGELSGPLRLKGTAGHLAVDGDLEGALGRIVVSGILALVPPHYGADGLTLEFNDLDLSMLSPLAPSTRLAGRLEATGTVDSLRPPEGRIGLNLQPGQFREFAFDSAGVSLVADGGRIGADTLFLLWKDGRLDGGGELGWSRGDSGEFTVAAEAQSLEPFDSLLTTLAGPADTTDSLSHWLDGSGEAALTLSGSLDSLRGQLNVALRDVLWRNVRSPGATLRADWTTGGRTQASGRVSFDSISVGSWSMLNGDAGIRGYADSLSWDGGVNIGEAGRVAAGGEWWQTPLAHGLLLDSLGLDLGARHWKLQEPVRALLGDSLIALSPLRVVAEDGSGDLKVAGLVPRAAGGAFQFSVNNLPMRDIYGLLERDGSDVSGTLSADLEINGTADRPDITGSVSLADASFGDFSAPFLQGILRYEDRRLNANLFLWKTGTPVMAVEADLPVDLALHPVPERLIDGPLLVRAHSDSTDLGVLEAFTRTVRGVRGSLAVDADIRGTWATPLLSGYLAVTNAAATLPALGVRYAEINGAATLRGDSVILDSLRLVSGKGTLSVGGSIEMRQLRHPILDVTLAASRFLAMDVRSLATLYASGQLRLQGPFRSPLLTGEVTADEGSYHFADLVTKKVVDLENPGDTSLIDVEQLRRQKLGASFVTRFLDSLSIRDLRVTMGESFWLRSTEANIQLEGTIEVDKVRDAYHVDGTLRTVRGRYNLYAGPFVKDFTVERGTVRYYGNPSLNADLDIEAKHVVRTWDGEDLPVLAQITGTMLAPKVTLSSEASAGRGTLSTTELFSYLMFGRASLGGSEAGGSTNQSQEAMLSTALTYFSSALSSELQRTLVTDLRLPIDYIEIKAGNAVRASTATQTGAVQVAQVAAGWRLGRQVFVTVRADICTNQTRFYPDVEYRFTPQFRVRTTLEPVWSCTDFRTGQSNLDTNRYQLGLDFLWEREY
jgi:hypothetical protein